jgi:MFS family permease
MTDNQKLLMTEGSCWAVFDNLTTPFIIPLALVLGATNTLVGLIAAMQYLAVMVSQAPGALLADRYPKRRMIAAIFAGTGRLLWIFAIAAILLIKNDTISWLVVFLFLFWFTASLADPAWTSLMGDVVPEKKRGRFFGKRNAIIGVGGMAAMFCAGKFLDLFPKGSTVGFAVIFAIAIAFGMLSIYFISKIREPRMKPHVHRLRDFLDIGSDFKKFTKIMIFFNFGYMFASPFFTVFALKNLGIDYTLFVTFTMVSAFTTIISQPYWGKILDIFGDKPVSVVCMAGTSLVPLFTLFLTPQNFYWIIPINMISGFAWAGQNLAAYNLLLDFSDRKKRAMQVADYNMLVAIPLIIAPMVGGLVADYGFLILSGLPLVFAIAFVLRLLAAYFMAGLREPRVKKEYRAGDVFRAAVSINFARGIVYDIKFAGHCVKCLFVRR